MDKVVHFEIPYKNDSLKDFYKNVFGWHLQEMPEMNYTIVTTSEVDEKFMHKEAGAINGGMFKETEENSKEVTIVINVDNVDDKLKEIEKAGGMIYRPKIKVGDMGLYELVKDTEGNIIGIWENIK